MSETLRVEVEGEVLRWAIDGADRDLDALSHSFPKIREWLEGKEKPTFRQLEKLSHALAVSFGFMFLPHPPEGTFAHPSFRTLQNKLVSRPSRNLTETLETMDLRRAWMSDYRQSIGSAPLEFVGASSQRTSPENLVELIRKTLGLDADWAFSLPDLRTAFKHLRAILEDRGVLVMLNGVVGNNSLRRLDVHEFRAFALRDDYAPLIFINGRDSGGGKIFSLMHEFCHLLLGRDDLFNARDEMESVDDAQGEISLETLCNRATANFLVPSEPLKHLWREKPDAKTLHRIQSIAAKFKVSALVVAIRARELSLIAPETLKAIRHDSTTAYEKKKTGGGGDFYRTKRNQLSAPFASAVVRQARAGDLPFLEAFRLLELSGKTYDTFAAGVP